MRPSTSPPMIPPVIPNRSPTANPADSPNTSPAASPRTLIRTPRAGASVSLNRDRHPLRRSNCLVTPRYNVQSRSTIKVQGCLRRPSGPDGESQARGQAPRGAANLCNSRSTTARPVSQALFPAIDEPDRRRVDVIGVSCAQEVFAVLDNPQLSADRIDELADLVLGVGHRVHGVRGAMHPQDRTSHAVQSSVQTVPVERADRPDRAD